MKEPLPNPYWPPSGPPVKLAVPHRSPVRCLASDEHIIADFARDMADFIQVRRRRRRALRMARRAGGWR